MSQRDVPGMTSSVIPLLRSAGVNAITIGIFSSFINFLHSLIRNEIFLSFVHSLIQLILSRIIIIIITIIIIILSSLSSLVSSFSGCCCYFYC
jgi:Na+-transporting NADH:ubiquinone oxidoreductase subunit NqrD